MTRLTRDRQFSGTQRSQPGHRGDEGRFVVVVGPDGVGKTTLATNLLDEWEGFYFHFCPELRRSLESTPLPIHQPPPKAPKSGSRVLGWIRLARNLFRFWLAYLVRIRPATRRGLLVVGDRWAYGYVGQPHGLRFYGPDQLGRAAIRLFPRPDAVLVLSASPSVIRDRKKELSEKEIEVESSRWDSLGVPGVVRIDASDDPTSMANRVLEVIRG